MILAIVLSLPSTLLAQTFTYAPINVPGAVATEARGINNNGEIVGFYKTATCSDYDSAGKQHGFLAKPNF